MSDDGPETIGFEKVSVKAYLDRLIVHWRKRKKGAIGEENKLIASCYIDAYQSVRISVFGELLKNE